MTIPKPVLLCILDGWGHSDETDHNAIAQANTPHWDALVKSCPHSLVDASAKAVGLPDGQMGNSEVGHTNIGAGRVVYQDLPKIDAAIESNELSFHPRLLDHIGKLRITGGTCHIMGLLSDGGVHSHQRHIMELARIIGSEGVPVALHLFLDGRDTPPKSALEFVKSCSENLPENVTIATISGRYYAMDRDNRWDRVEKAYRAIVQGKTPTRAPDAVQAVNAAYVLGQTDEFILPTALGDYKGMQKGDGLLMANFRADRARQLLHSLIDPEFNQFETHSIDYGDVLGMVEYSSELAKWIVPLYPPDEIKNSLGEVVSNAGLKQLRIAETEKYAHVTFFFNGGSEAVYEGEDRILVPSPQVATYDLQPEMSAPEVTDKLVKAIQSDKYSLIICNYANTDMVGHSGNIQAAIKAVEAVDTALGALTTAIEQAGGAMLITADHGNAEKMQDADTQQPHTAHTTNLVPFLIKGVQGIALKNGVLADIAPTILQLLKLQQPKEMTGTSLIQ